MKKKGFTLIELLAVIIILSIIALIVTPMISNLIANARKAAAKSSAQGYVDAVKNKISLSALDNQNIHGIKTVSELDSVLEYSGSRVEKGIVIVDGDILEEAKLCVNGYSFKYYSDKLEESNIDYCVDKSNLEITVLGTSIEEELNNQYSYDLDLTSYDISSATNVVCNNNAIPSIDNDTLHITDVFGDTKCSIESSIVTTFANLDDTTNTIVMLSDETIDSTLIASASKDVVLDLNGTTITKQGGANDAIENHGNMIINDGLGTGKIVNTNTACGRGVVTYGEIVLNNVNIEVSGTCAALLIGYTSNPHGSATVNNSSMKGSNTHVVGAASNDSLQLIINNSTIEGGNGRTVNIQGTGNVIINGGTYTTRSGNVIKNISESTLDINGGTYVNEGGAEVITNTSSGTINISDGDSRIYIINNFSSPSNDATPKAVYNTGSGTININGTEADVCNENINSNTTGTCILSYRRAVLNENGATGTINVNGGTVVSKGLSAVDNYTGTININGGTYYSTGNRVISNMSSGTMNISDSNSRIYIGNLFTNPSSVWSPTAVYNLKTGIININGKVANTCNENIGSNTSGICVFSYYRSILNENNATGTINVNGVNSVSKNLYAASNYSGTMNITSGIFVGEGNSAITVENTGTTNITQTDKPIYILTLSQVWHPALIVNSSGTLNILANQANACSANIADTTSGLCVYAPGDGSDTAAANVALNATSSGMVNVNGGTYYGGHISAEPSGTSVMNIKNVLFKSGRYGLSTGNNSSSTLNICNSRIDAQVKDMRTLGAGTTINYSSDVIFTDGTNTPTISTNNGTINAVSTCPITE